ncbi:hypothetical protein ACQCN2_09865 [Brevibacillus ginsengisoli]|uniref:hypothetical protein n=1 Tax=Brevibacillus ginsengisoli TaxID=363854 RepID=UPI003CF660A2
MHASLEMLLEELVLLTQTLKSTIEQYSTTSEEVPDDWVDILEKRQLVMDQISLQLQEGSSLTEKQKLQLLDIQQVDQHLIPLMVENKNKVQTQINQLNKTKVMNQQYNGYGVKTAYGAFFDKKK